MYRKYKKNIKNDFEWDILLSLNLNICIGWNWFSVWCEIELVYFELEMELVIIDVWS